MNRIVINSNLCKGCGYCLLYCPKQIIKIGENFNAMGFKYAVPNDLEKKCTACKTCAMMCPDAAINVYREEKEEGKCQ